MNEPSKNSIMNIHIPLHQIRQTIAFLSSMIYSGEQHTELSKSFRDRAYENIEAIREFLASEEKAVDDNERREKIPDSFLRYIIETTDEYSRNSPNDLIVGYRRWMESDTE